MRLLIGACTAYNKNTATENMNHRSTYCPIEWTVYYMKGDQRRGLFPCGASLWSLERKDLSVFSCLWVYVLQSLHKGANGACQGDDKYMYMYSCLLTN